MASTSLAIMWRHLMIYIPRAYSASYAHEYLALGMLCLVSAYPVHRRAGAAPRSTISVTEVDENLLQRRNEWFANLRARRPCGIRPAYLSSFTQDGEC